MSKNTKNTDLFSKMKAMRLSGMAAEFKRQQEDINIGLLSAEERINRLIVAEEDVRFNNKINRYLKNSNIRYPEAVINKSVWDNSRGVDFSMIEGLLSCDWIDQAKNVIITGPTGSGKTYLASALGVSALHKFKKVKYVRTSFILNQLKAAEEKNRLSEKVLEIQKADLLILDDFAMAELSIAGCRGLFELLESREKRSATIFVSQYPVSAWYELFANPTFADACLDRALYRAYRIELSGKSFRSRDPEGEEK